MGARGISQRGCTELQRFLGVSGRLEVVQADSGRYAFLCMDFGFADFEGRAQDRGISTNEGIFAMFFGCEFSDQSFSDTALLNTKRTLGEVAESAQIA